MPAQCAWSYLRTPRSRSHGAPSYCSRVLSPPLGWNTRATRCMLNPNSTTTILARVTNAWLSRSSVHRCEMCLRYLVERVWPVLVNFGSLSCRRIHARTYISCSEMLCWKRTPPDMSNTVAQSRFDTWSCTARSHKHDFTHMRCTIQQFSTSFRNHLVRPMEVRRILHLTEHSRRPNKNHQAVRADMFHFWNSSEPPTSLNGGTY